MKLIMSDRPIAVIAPSEDTSFVDLSQAKVTNCVGCFGCWTKTPGRCVIRDEATKIYPLIAASDRVIYVSRLAYGGYDLPMKKMLERAIPIQQAFIRLVDGETHHVQRAVAPKEALIVAYGEYPAEERELFLELVARNAKNMNFKSYRVLFVPEGEVEEAVGKEVMRWKES